MAERRFEQVDVFTDVAYRGNPVGVVLDGDGLTPEQMQQFTDWTNLSECTFVLPRTDPAADYRVRIFCPGRELPFAGHPTLGTCHAWLRAGGVSERSDTVVQECGVGLVPIRRDRAFDRLAFAAPPLIKSGPLSDDEVMVIARGLGVDRADIVDHAWCDNGPNWRGVLLRSASQVLAVRPDPAILEGWDVGVVGLHDRPSAQEPDIEIRAFFPGNSGLTEDPVTGSLNAAVAMWLIGNGTLPDRYVAAQGTSIARAGRVFVERDGDEIWVGGASISCITGHVTI